MEKFCWVCDVDSWKIYVVMILAMWEFICACAWTCGKFLMWKFFFFLFCMAMEKFGSCVWIREKFWLYWNFGGALIWFDFLLWWALVVRIFFFFFLWKFLVMWVLVMEINELNFCVVEPQESRQSRNVEKCMGNIMS